VLLVVFVVVLSLSKGSDFSSRQSVASLSEVSSADWEDFTFGFIGSLTFWELVTSASFSGIFSAVSWGTSVGSIAPWEFLGGFSLVFFSLAIFFFTISGFVVVLGKRGSSEASFNEVSSADWEHFACGIIGSLTFWELVTSAFWSVVFSAVSWSATVLSIAPWEFNGWFGLIFFSLVVFLLTIL